MGVWNRARSVPVLGSPLVRTGRALHQLPVIFEQVLQVVVAPLRWGGGPGDFQAAADRVVAVTSAKGVHPTETLLLDRGPFRFGTDVLAGIGSAVGLAERMTAGNQRNRLHVIHRHPGECLSDVPRRSDWIGFSIWSFRIHVNQSHLHRGERIGEITIAAVALVRKPLAFRAPVDVITRLPHIFAAAAETEGLKSHRFQCHVTREDHEVGPRDLPAILLLDGPEQSACLIEVHIVGPAIEGCKTLFAGARPPAAVADAVSASGMPRHTNEKRPIVAEVGGPPLLRIRHQGMKVLDHGLQVELLEFFGIVELLAHGIGQRRVLVQDTYINLIGPPLRICRRPSQGVLASAVRYRAF